MSYTVKLNHPNFAKGTPLDVKGVGLIENGGSVKIEDEQLFKAKTGMTVKEYFKDSEMIEVTGSSIKEGGDN
jgi:hypothetical protein